MNFLTQLLTLIATVVAGAGVWVNYEQLKAMREQFRIDQVPIVYARVQTPSLAPDGRLCMSTTLGNYGKSIALDVSGTYRVFFGPSAAVDAEQWFDLGALVSGGRAPRWSIPPGVSVSSPDALTTYQCQRPPLGFQPTSEDVVIAARLTYRDIQGFTRRTDLCVRFGPKGTENCELHNEVK